MFSTPEELVAYIGDNDVEVFDIRFCDLLGHHEPPHGPGVDGHRRVAGRRHGVRRLVHQGLPVDPRVGHDAAARRRHRAGRSVPQAQDAELQLLRARPADAAAPYSRDPRNVARKAEEYLASTGIADTCFFGAEAEFYIFDNVRSSTEHDRHLLQDGLRRGLVEHRPRRRPEPRLQGPDQGWLLPGPAVRPPRRPARGHDREPDQHGLRHRARPPRGRTAARPRSTTSSTPCSPRPTR